MTETDQITQTMKGALCLEIISCTSSLSSVVKLEYHIGGCYTFGTSSGLGGEALVSGFMSDREH